jgi:hypothetical protein
MYNEGRMSQLKIGFGENGLTLNSKEFDPLNISVNGHGIESTRSVNKVDPFEAMANLAAIRSESSQSTRMDKIKALQSVIKL